MNCFCKVCNYEWTEKVIAANQKPPGACPKCGSNKLEVDRFAVESFFDAFKDLNNK